MKELDKVGQIWKEKHFFQVKTAETSIYSASVIGNIATSI